MKRILNFGAMLLAVVAVFAMGCHKENDNNGGGTGNGGSNGGNGGGDTPAVTTYTVTFDANGGTGTMQPQTFTEGEAQALIANAFTYQYHTFVNWNTMADGSGTSYTDGQEVTIAGNTTLYAQWQHITYTVTFDSNGGTGTMQPQTFTEGETKSLTANTFVREDYWFLGWNTAADGSGTAYSDQQEVTLTENLSLYAQWKPLKGELNGHEWVDLGLPSGTLWATTNVGASSPTDYGDYFAWGETQPQADNAYSWNSYKYCNGSPSTLTKYCNSSSYGDNGFTDNLTTLEASDDAATANWGGAWRMPTNAEMQELKDKCTVTWTTQNGVNGCLFTASNGNSLFLPAAGFRWGGFLSDTGNAGYYWSSSLSIIYPYYARHLCFDSGNCYMISNDRYSGFCVRPVCAN